MASSPTPWIIRPHLPDAHFEVVADAAGNTVGTATRREDAALIVDAVNGAEATRRLLRKLLGWSMERDRLRDLVRRLADEYEQLEEVDLVCNTDRHGRIEALLREALGEGE